MYKIQKNGYMVECETQEELEGLLTLLEKKELPKENSELGFTYPKTNDVSTRVKKAWQTRHKMKTRAFKHWKKGEIRKLNELKASGKDWRDIAVELGRSKIAIERKWYIENR